MLPAKLLCIIHWLRRLWQKCPIAVCKEWSQEKSSSVTNKENNFLLIHGFNIQTLSGDTYTMQKKETSDTSYKQQDGNSEILFLNLVSIDPELAASYNFSELSFVLKTVKWQLSNHRTMCIFISFTHTLQTGQWWPHGPSTAFQIQGLVFLSMTKQTKCHLS